MRRTNQGGKQVQGKPYSGLKRSKHLLRTIRVHSAQISSLSQVQVSRVVPSCVLHPLVLTTFRNVRRSDSPNQLKLLIMMGIVEEQFYVLKKGGFVNGLSFPLWDEPLAFPFEVSSVSPYQFVGFIIRQNILPR